MVFGGQITLLDPFTLHVYSKHVIHTEHAIPNFRGRLLLLAPESSNVVAVVDWVTGEERVFPLPHATRSIVTLMARGTVLTHQYVQYLDVDLPIVLRRLLTS